MLSKLYISEIFDSIQGEGKKVGEFSRFVRFYGCNLQCPFCDTKWSRVYNFFDNSYIDEEHIEEYSKKLTDDLRMKNIVITGGEPLDCHKYELMIKFICDLLQHNANITVESNGLFNLDKNIDTEHTIYDSMTKLYSNFSRQVTLSISPKLNTLCYISNTINKEEFILNYFTCNRNIDLFGRLATNFDFYYKFIYSEDTEKLLVSIIKNLPEWYRGIYIMPMTPVDYFSEDLYKENCLKTVEFCKKYQLNYSPRLHINLWGTKHGV